VILAQAQLCPKDDSAMAQLTRSLDVLSLMGAFFRRSLAAETSFAVVLELWLTLEGHLNCYEFPSLKRQLETDLQKRNLLGLSVIGGLMQCSDRHFG
jgi:hypothetical protein